MRIDVLFILKQIEKSIFTKSIYTFKTMYHRFFFWFILCFISQVLSAQNLKLMTYNIRLDIASDQENAWPNRKDFLCAQIQFYAPDVFGIQEALPHQVQDLTAFFKDYKYIGVGRDGVNQGESSNIFYNTKRLTLLKESTFWLSETPDKISKGWDAALNRICTYGLFEVQTTKQRFWVFNTHLDHVGNLAKTNAIQLILSKIKTLNRENHPVFLMGDFNSEPFEERIIDLNKTMKDAYFVSKEKPFGPEGTFNAFRHQEPVQKRIDYIFVSKDDSIQVLKHAILSDSKDLKYPSDHLPVIIEVGF